MATFNETLTTEGKNLIARMLSGTASITFTRIVMGDGAITQSAMATVSDVVNPKKVIDIYSVTRDSSNNITVTGIFSNDGIDAGFYFREKGIYATDGTTEILFLYGNNGSLAEWINPIGNAVIQKKLSTIITFSEADTINISLQDGIYASHEDMLQIIEEIQNIQLDGDWAKYSQAEQIKEDSKDIQSKLGNSSNDDTSTTIFGFLKNIKNAIASFITKFDSFRTAYTDTRAANLDNFDATISSRAPASTALSNTIWTDTRAVAIDTINTNTARLTAARATTIDNIGATSNTGGTTTAGTAMAKLNAVLTKMDAILSKVEQGDFVGKRLLFESDLQVTNMSKDTYYNVKSYSNNSGGIAVIVPFYVSNSNCYYTLVVDGVTVFADKNILVFRASSGSDTDAAEGFVVPFISAFELKVKVTGVTSSTDSGRFNIRYYINK